MKKLLKYTIPALIVSLMIAGVAQAQVFTPSYWVKIGNNLYPVGNVASTTIGSSTAVGQFATLTDANGNLYSTSTSGGAGGVSTSTANTWTAAQTFQSSTIANGNLTVSSTETITNQTSANTLSVVANTNTGSGASTNGNLFVNCSSDTAGLCENINQENTSLSSAQPLLYLNSGAPDNTTASGTQTLTNGSSSFTVQSTSGWPTSGYLLVQQSTSTSQNANGVILQYTSTNGTQFLASAGTLYPGNTPFLVTDQDKVTYVDNNDHQVKQMIYQHSENGAGTPLKLVGTGNLGLEWTQQGTNNASGSGQFQLDIANNYGTVPQNGDVFRIEVRNQTNSAFNPAFGITGLQEGALACFGDCQNYITPWNAAWEGQVNIYPNSGNGSTVASTTPELVVRQPDTGSPDFVHLEASSSVRILTIDSNGNVSTTGNFFSNGIELPTSTPTHSITVTTSTPTTAPAVDSTSTQATATNSVATTTAYTLTIPANKLGTAGAMYDIKESGEFVQNSGQTLAPYIVYLALNGVQVASATPQTLAGASSPTGTWYAEYTLANFGGATNTQIEGINTFAQRGGIQLLPRTNTAISFVDSTQPITLSIWISNASTTATESVTSGQVATQFIGSAPAVVTGVTYN